jgi:PadR family transcriptional regulator AphA
MLKYILLGFLNYASMTGYEMEGWINVSTGNFWHAELSQIYKTLKKLEEDGLVSSQIEPQDGRPDKRVYSLAPAGKARLQTWLETPDLDEVVKKDALLVRLFFSPPGDQAALIVQLRVQLQQHRRKLDHYQSQAPQAMMEFAGDHPELAANILYWEAARRHGILYEEMYIRWIEETIAMLENDVAG